MAAAWEKEAEITRLKLQLGIGPGVTATAAVLRLRVYTTASTPSTPAYPDATRERSPAAQRLLDEEALSHAGATACIADAAALREELIHVVTAGSPPEGSKDRDATLAREISILRRAFHTLCSRDAADMSLVQTALDALLEEGCTIEKHYAAKLAAVEQAAARLSPSSVSSAAGSGENDDADVAEQLQQIRVQHSTALASAQRHHADMTRRQVDDMAARHAAAVKIQREVREGRASADLQEMRQAHQQKFDTQRREAAEALSALEEQYAAAVEEIAGQHTAAAQIQRQFRRNQSQADAQALIRAAHAQQAARVVTVAEGEPPADAKRVAARSVPAVPPPLPYRAAAAEDELVPMAEMQILLEESAAAVEQMRTNGQAAVDTLKAKTGVSTEAIM